MDKPRSCISCLKLTRRVLEDGEDIVVLIDAQEPVQKKRGQYKKRQVAEISTRDTTRRPGRSKSSHDLRR